MASPNFIPLEVTNQVNKYLKKITDGKGDLKGGSFPLGEISEQSFHDAAVEIFNGASKHAAKQVIGQAKFDNGNDVLKFIKQFDPNNSSGAVQPSVDIMQKLLKQTDPLQALQGMLGGQLYGIMNQIMGLINQAGKGGGGSNGGVKVGSPCTLASGGQGTLQVDINGNLGCFAPTTTTITINPGGTTTAPAPTVTPGLTPPTSTPVGQAGV